MLTMTKPHERDDFLNQFDDPTKYLAQELIEAKDTDTSRILPQLDRFEIDCRRQLGSYLHLSATDSPSDRVERVSSFWKKATELCLHVLVKAALTKELNAIRKIPTILLEDAIDSLPRPECCELWNATVQSHYDLLFSETLWNLENESGKVCWLPFLKVTNKWIRKVNHMPRVVSSILITLSKVYPISEKSATKVWGSYNTEHNIEIEEEDAFQSHVEETEKEPHSRGNNYSTYHSIWKLQEDFANPNGIKVAEFLQRLEVCLSAFEGQQQLTEKPMTASTKYLTNSRLLNIQLSDSEFLVHVMTQLLVCVNHLSAQIPILEVKCKPFALRARKLLEERVEYGSRHLQMTDRILSTSEKEWREWKKSKCVHDIDQPLSSKRAGKRKRLGDTIMLDNDSRENKESNHQQQLDMNVMAEVAAEMHPPVIDDFLQDYVDALDPEAGIEEEYHPKNDKMFHWRTFRLLRTHHLDKFGDIRPDGDFEKAVRLIYTSKGVTIPGEAPADLEESEDEKEVENRPQEDAKKMDEAYAEDMEDEPQSQTPAEIADDKPTAMETDETRELLAGDDEISEAQQPALEEIKADVVAEGSEKEKVNDEMDAENTAESEAMTQDNSIQENEAEEEPKDTTVPEEASEEANGESKNTTEEAKQIDKPVEEDETKEKRNDTGNSVDNARKDTKRSPPPRPRGSASQAITPPPSQHSSSRGGGGAQLVQSQRHRSRNDDYNRHPRGRGGPPPGGPYERRDYHPRDRPQQRGPPDAGALPPENRRGGRGGRGGHYRR